MIMGIILGIWFNKCINNYIIVMIIINNNSNKIDLSSNLKVTTWSLFFNILYLKKLITLF